MLDAPPLADALCHDPVLRHLKLVALPSDDSLLPRWDAAALLLALRPLENLLLLFCVWHLGHIAPARPLAAHVTRARPLPCAVLPCPAPVQGRPARLPTLGPVAAAQYSLWRRPGGIHA